MRAMLTTKPDGERKALMLMLEKEETRQRDYGVRCPPRRRCMTFRGEACTSDGSHLMIVVIVGGSFVASWRQLPHPSAVA